MPLHLIQFFYGFNLFTKEDKIVRIFQILLKVVSFFGISSSVVYALTFTLISPKSLFNYSINLKSLTVLISYIYFNIKIDKIRLILVQINSELTKPDYRRMSNINFVFFFIWAFLVTINTALGGWVSSTYIHRFVFEVIWSVFVFGWILVCVLFKIYLCSAIYLIEREILRQTNIIGTSQENNSEELKLNNEEVLNKFLSLEKLKQSIDDNLGLLPLLWFLESFSSTCLRLTQMASDNIAMVNDKNKIILFIDYFVEYSMLSIAYLFYIICLNYFQIRRPTKNDLIIWLKSQSTVSRFQSVANNCDIKFLLSQHLVHCYANNTYKAWNLFEIDVKFIFGFFGSVITFAVMGIQIINK